MDRTISAADANRRFSELLRKVREGRSFVVTAHGRAVARIVRASDADRTAAGARSALLARLRRQPVRNIRRWTRDELYEDAR